MSNYQPPLRLRLPRLIGLCGIKQAGKDSVGAVLQEEFGFQRRAFADKLKELAVAMNPRISAVVSVWGWEHAKAQDWIRTELQHLGVAAREILGPDVWVDAALPPISVFEWATRPTVVTDVRFTNEVYRIRFAGKGEIWEVRRPGLPDEDDHISEHEWRQARPDKVIHNDGSLEDLRYTVRRAYTTAGTEYHGRTSV